VTNGTDTLQIREARVSHFPAKGSAPAGHELPNLPHPPVSCVPAEMCELSELCEVSRQDAMESLFAKGAMGGGESLF
jgi:hypothetical protein